MYLSMVVSAPIQGTLTYILHSNFTQLLFASVLCTKTSKDLHMQITRVSCHRSGSLPSCAIVIFSTGAFRPFPRGAAPVKLAPSTNNTHPRANNSPCLQTGGRLGVTRSLAMTIIRCTIDAIRGATRIFPRRGGG